MSVTEQTTLDLIRSAAMQEFLEKGFKSASLRNIVKTAGVTTGAFTGILRARKIYSRRWWANSMTIF